MRIAFIVNNYPPRVGGVELHVQALAFELAAQGHLPLVVTLGDQPQRRQDHEVDIVVLAEYLRVGDTLGFPRLGTRRMLTRLLRSEQIDAVSIHTRFFPMSFIGLRAARAARIPVVHTEHGSGHVVSDSPVVRHASRLVDRTVGRWVLRHASRVLGVSEAVVAFVKRLSGVEATVFYNAIATPGNGAAASPQDPHRTVFVGRLIPGKGWDTYLDALAAVRASGVPVIADLIGDGPDMPRVRTLVQELDLSENVTIHGRLPQNSVRSMLRGATLVNPTVLAEGFQTTLIESVSEGGRVVTFAVPGAQMLSEAGAPISIVAESTTDALVSALRENLGNSWEPIPSEAVAQWTWPRQAKEFARMCAELTSSSRESRR